MPAAKPDIMLLIEDVFIRRGDDTYLGEQVTMAEHMLQAAWWAEDAGADNTLIVAALLHDVGHFTGEFGVYSTDDTEDRFHDQAGAKALEPYFPTVISESVRMHVAAKRYLCAIEPEYFEQLSHASIHTLELQGGPMSNTEIVAFEATPFHQAAVFVRKCDDRAKVPGMKTKPFKAYVAMLETMVTTRTT